MKRIVSLLLSIVFVVCMASCSRTVEQPQKQQENALLKLNINELGNISLVDLNGDDKYAVLHYTNFIEPENGDEMEGESAQQDAVHYYLAIFDVKKNKLKNKIEIDNPKDDYFKVNIVDDKVNLVNQGDGSSFVYDTNLDYIDSTKIDAIVPWQQGEKVGLDIARFDCKDKFAISTGYGVAQSVVFYDASNQYHMIKENKYYEYRDCVNHNILVVDNSCNATSAKNSILRILDFDNNAEINNIEIDNNYSNFNNINHAIINEKVVSLSTLDASGKLDSVYIWNYNLNAQNTPFEKDYCDTFLEQDIQSKIDGLCLRVKEKYAIQLDCNTNCEFIKESFDYKNDMDLIFVYQKALEIEYYLSIFPKEIYTELLCGDIENGIAAHDEFRLYLVGEFPDDNIDAFAADIGCEETDNKFVAYIVYSCTGLNQKTFFHEFMHTFAYRIYNYEKDFDKNWEKLNPKVFEYTSDYSDVFYSDDHKEYQEYFTRDYGMKTIEEDKATCFEELMSNDSTDEIWWKDKPNILKKEKYLIEVLEKTFPSLKDYKQWQYVKEF